jgi:hypothetical protein
MVALADAVIYRGQGFAGLALLFLVSPGLLLLGAPQPKRSGGLWIAALMLVAAAARLFWCGSWLMVAAGFALLVAFAATLAGLCPYVVDVVAYGLQTFTAGCVALAHYGGSAPELAPQGPRSRWLNVALPALALLAFGALFVMANPDLATWYADYLGRFFRSLWDWVREVAPTWQEVLLWVAVAWFVAGLLRPVLRQPVLDSLWKRRGDEAGRMRPPAESPLYAAFRNTLVTVIVLFAVYLVFEFKTLWFRVFPKGFYYAGYAHEGAAWLTAALALATVVLSAIFRAGVLADPRLARLRRLAWLWSAENLLLALAVYHRMYIYVGFNGMTRMRTVGLFGISAVVVGFVLVVWKIVKSRDFLWLFHRHLWTVAVAAYLFALAPVDAIVHTYNRQRILNGDPAPSVQISVHPIDSEGALVLRPLVYCKDEIIREGIRAMLAQRAEEALAAARLCDERGWTAFQLADRLLLEQLENARADWMDYADPAKRSAALARFHSYAYQWY